jgi:hypothetical protein
VFESFFLAGFEGTTGHNLHGEWIDQVAATQHDLWAELDYRLLRECGIAGVREAVRWPLVDRNGRYDFRSLRPFIDAARRYRIEIIFDLFHFGYPSGVDLFSPEFPERFADYCYATARYVSRESDGTCYFTPVNEPSYFSWAAGEVGLFGPHQLGRGWELKVSLIGAAIQGINAIRSACPKARIVNVDPICRVVAPRDRPDLQPQADHFNDSVVFQGWDMLSGRLLPGLGGSRSHLDIVGANYYWTNQWEINQPDIPLAPGDDRHSSVGRLLQEVWHRYRTDVIITETSQVGDKRAGWVREVAHESEKVLRAGIPLRGVCLYPATGMPEWHARHEWTSMGLWDLVPRGHVLERVGCAPMLDALREAQNKLADAPFEAAQPVS